MTESSPPESQTDSLSRLLRSARRNKLTCFEVEQAMGWILCQNGLLDADVSLFDDCISIAARM
jgi:hypothetical protein